MPTLDCNAPTELQEQDAELIGFASTEGGHGMLDRRRLRWSELRVWFLHNPKIGGKRWVAETAGISRISGETPIRNRLHSGTLERAVKLFAPFNEPGIIAAEQAMEWREDNRVTVHHAAQRNRIAFDSDSAAAEWLCGNGLEYARIRETLDEMDNRAGGDDGDWNAIRVPLRDIAPFIDREAFRRAALEMAHG